MIAFRQKLSLAIDEGWRDREAVLIGVVESGGMGLGGSVEKAKDMSKPTVIDWKGLGVLAR